MMPQISGLGVEMPRYKCHKVVHALKIARLEARPGIQGTLLVPADEGYGAFGLEPAWVEKFQPKAGGYFVVYEDGYQSFSPARAFEEGYTPL